MFNCFGHKQGMTADIINAGIRLDAGRTIKVSTYSFAVGNKVLEDKL